MCYLPYQTHVNRDFALAIKEQSIKEMHSRKSLKVPNFLIRSSLFVPCNNLELSSNAERVEEHQYDATFMSALSINGKHLNMFKDLPLLMFACQHLYKNEQIHQTNPSENVCTVKLLATELLLATRAKKFVRAKDFDPIVSALSRLSQTTLVFKDKDDKVLFDGKLLERFECPVSSGSDKCAFLTFSNRFRFFVRFSQRYTFINYTTYLSLSSEIDRKLFLYLSSQSKDFVDFKYSLLEELCGFNRQSRAHVKPTKIREYIAKSLRNLKSCGYVNEFNFYLSENRYRITRSSHQYEDVNGKPVPFEDIRSNFSLIKRKKKIEKNKFKGEPEDDLPF